MYNQPHPNVQDISRRVSINLRLNPIEDAVFHHPHRASQVMLPPLNSLDLLKGQFPAPQPIHQYQAPPRFRQRREQQREQQREQHREQHGELHREHYNHHSSPSGSSSTSHRRSGSNSPTPSSHSNVPYTLEQVHFIQYYREDKNIQWQAIVDPFKAQFPRVVFPQSNESNESNEPNEPNGPKGPDRQKGALECRYYRAQMYPKIDDGGNFVFDQNGDVEWMNIKVRDRNNYQHISILQEYFKLVTRCPEEVLTYSWTDENDKKEAKRIIEGRAMQGRGRLLGGLIRVRPTL